MTNEPSKLITVVLDQDRTAERLVLELRDAFAITTANVQHARGTWAGSGRSGARSGRVAEKDILTAIVPASRADEVFRYIYDAAEIGTRYGGFMYMGPLQKAVPFLLPDLPDET